MINILVTNDDGVEAEGITALAAALREMEGVYVKVVAPDREQSSVSHSLSLHRPLRLVKKDSDVYVVDGTPSDAVFLGTTVLFKTKPDFVFSGINRGGNLGDDVHYSGTVSAAIEGAIMGIPSIALSQLGGETFDYSVAAQFTKKIFHLVRQHSLPPNIVLNVNVPENPKSLEFTITKTGKRDYGALYEKRKDPRGRSYYWIGGNRYNFFDRTGSDCNAILEGKISVTPLEINLTSHDFMKEMASWK